MDSHIIYFCTGNLNKVKEVAHKFAEILPDYTVFQKKVPMHEIQAETLEEVAHFKLESIQSQIVPPFFIEDAGFFVDDQLNGFPGVYSHYVMDTLGCEGILTLMHDREPRKAHFEAVIAYMDDNRAIHLFKGENHGTVSYQARGTSGFGFDPVFISNDTPDQTFAEIGLEAKNKISHRTRALNKLITHLQTGP